MQTCTICFCDGPVAQGVCCAERHYTCGDCFEAYVRSEAGKPLGELKKRDGRVVCPSNTDAMKGVDRCHAPPFADKDIASNVSDEAFEAYLRAREKLKEETMAEEMRTEMERRVELERERAAAGAGAAEKLRAAKEHIIENIITLCCPRCKQAFVDFDGCFALSCSRCGAGFCAYCLADCGRDAHQHVGTCPEGIASVKASKTTRRVGGHPPTVYGSKEAFEVSQKRRRCKHLALYLERHDAETRDALLTSLKKELDDLKITAKDVKHWQNKEAKAIADRERRQAPRGGARRGGGGGGGGGVDAIRAAAHAAAHAALMRGRRHIGEFLGGFPDVEDDDDDFARGGGARPARGGARRRRDAAFDPVEARARLRRAGFAPGPPGGFGARDDDLEDLLAAGIDVRPPWLGPGHGPGLGPNEGLLPGENPEGVLGPLRRARAERREREAAERAARAGRVEHVDLLADENSPAAGHAAGPAGGRRRIRDGKGDEGDVCDLTKSPVVDAGDGGGSGRRNAKRRVGDVAGSGEGGAAATAVNETVALVDLT